MTKPTGRPRGAPPLPPDRKRGVRIEVRATPAELAEIDRRREQEAATTATEPDTRSDWLLRAAGVRPVAAPTQYRSDTLYVTDSVRADLRAAMQTTPVVRLDSTTGSWIVADGWTAAETEPGMFTVQRDGEPVAVVRGPGVRLDIGMTAPRRRVDFTFDDLTAVVESLDRKESRPPALIVSESRCAGDADYRPATAEERAAEPGLHGFALGVLGAPVPVYEPALAGTEPKERKP